MNTVGVDVEGIVDDVIPQREELENVTREVAVAVIEASLPSIVEELSTWMLKKSPRRDLLGAVDWMWQEIGVSEGSFLEQAD